MSPIPIGLLQLLGSAAASIVRPQSSPNVEGVSFDEMLELAKSGDVSSELGVQVDPGLGVELSQEQSARLGLAADRALASGASDVVVLLDGMALRLDVQNRRVTGTVDLDDQRELMEIDGLISAAPDATGPGEIAGPGASATPMNPSLMELLSQAKRAG